MAKTTNEGSWEAVKTTKGTKKGATTKGSPTISKGSPIKSISKATAQTKTEPKPEKKKSKAPAKQPFSLKEDEVGNIGGSGKGIVANMNALNFLTAEFTAPERIPPYDKDGADFPASRLSPKAKARIENILSSLTADDSEQFLKVLINNLISASRHAENAWGARVMGQLLMRKYPELANRNTHDFLQTETHPGAVLSVLWLFSQVKNFSSLMCNLFVHVLPRLKQKKVAEYLPKILGDIELAMKAGGEYLFRPNHVVGLVYHMTDPKLAKPVANQLLNFFNRIRPALRPNHDWIRPFVLILNGGERQQLALPIILSAIEADPAKAAQELRHLSDDYRLQTELILQSCPESTLSQKYRDIVQAKLTQPIMTGRKKSEQVNHPRSSKKNGAKAATTTTTANGKAKSNKPGKSIFARLGSIIKLALYLGLVIGVSSKLECTRPHYQHYAQPYVTEYVQPAIDKAGEIVLPKYEEYIQPQVELYIIPAYSKYILPTYQQHIAPKINDAAVLWNEKVIPVLSEKLGQVQTVYDENVAPKVDQLWNNVKPTLLSIQDQTIVYGKEAKLFLIKNGKWIQLKAGEVTNGWEGKVESFILEARAYVAVAGIEARKLIDLSVVKAGEYYKQALVLLQDGTAVGQEKAIEFYAVAKENTINGVEIGIEKLSELYAATSATVANYYEKFLASTVDQRAIVAEKGGIVLAWVTVKGGELVDLLNEYKVGFYLEKAFDGLGYSIIWIGDAMTELIGMRTCCLKSRFRKLGNSIHNLGNDIYSKVAGSN